MRRHTSITLLVLTGTLLLAGCGGPTKKGIEARSAAAERVNMVNAQVSYDQARRSFETGEFDRALREINGAIARYEDVADYHILRGRILLEMHRLEAAQRSFNRAIELDDMHPEAFYFAGIVNQRWSRHEEAYEHYRAASAIDSENVQYLLAAVESLIALGQYAEARIELEDRLPYHDHNAAMRHLLGHIAMLEGSPTEAASLFQEARLLNPDDDMLLEELCWARFDAGQYAACYDALQELYQANPAASSRHDLRHLEARTLARLDRFVDARRIYIELSQQTPGDADVWIELAAIALELGDERRFDQGSAQAMRIAPERHEGYLLRAVFEREQGKLRQAERMLNEAIKRTGTDNPNSSLFARIMLGQLLEDQGRLQQARAAYAEAVRLHPESTEAKNLLALFDHRYALTAVTE
jgi:tetratricopeptide (TPR) repeat protein